MKYLLDTDHISFLQRRSGLEFTRLTARMGQHSSADFALSIVSFHEQVLGAHNFINRARTNADMIRGYALLLEILQGFTTAPILPFDAGAIALFDQLRSQRVRVSTMDLRIAAIAISRNLVLLTRNFSDFNKVPGLVMEDWTL
ncbi:MULTISPECIES: type II toxin-antitoxin system VapC family toxin [unclassified Nostoc]|uniref:type II toxin-antitoxin system VapC family toxin n=1 Tax=unclassified Nostoc TaxID=2593658 RepID=UPI000B958289|nr:type II toxin-antitoxin system VapC family toxin [Nostoc sp. 'Peltigera membranacea cyanobiont' 232]OYE01859.1 twitching motility protein PilT [Nostoc sp. 'Peltigera membranacea cyanobiont' 232]